MYLGNYTIGQEVVLPLHATDAGPSPVAQASAPSVKVFDASGSQIVSAPMAALDRPRSTGLFYYRLTLDAAFGPGRYLVEMAYGGLAKMASFDIVPGGDPAGAIVSQYHLERPQANHLVQKTDGGKRFFKRGPHL